MDSQSIAESDMLCWHNFVHLCHNREYLLPLVRPYDSIQGPVCCNIQQVQSGTQYSRARSNSFQSCIRSGGLAEKMTDWIRALIILENTPPGHEQWFSFSRFISLFFKNKLAHLLLTCWIILFLSIKRAQLSMLSNAILCRCSPFKNIWIIVSRAIFNSFEAESVKSAERALFVYFRWWIMSSAETEENESSAVSNFPPLPRWHPRGITHELSLIKQNLPFDIIRLCGVKAIFVASRTLLRYILLNTCSINDCI